MCNRLNLLTLNLLRKAKNIAQIVTSLIFFLLIPTLWIIDGFQDKNDESFSARLDAKFNQWGLRDISLWTCCLSVQNVLEWVFFFKTVCIRVSPIKTYKNYFILLHFCFHVLDGMKKIDRSHFNWTSLSTATSNISFYSVCLIFLAFW